MITKHHPTAYNALFEKAQDILRKNGFPDATILNIDDYFGYLESLADIEESNGLDPIFTILPATTIEDTFNIDANSRKISIPDNFAKYGVGVTGDEIAEILYFSIDRYFDAIDLATMDIIIQWEHKTQNNQLESLSAIYNKSLTLHPGKIVFGWPVISQMTEEAGIIEFSVRFYKREDGTNNILYSFSTLPAQIKIQPSLDFDLSRENTINAFNKNAIIRSNLVNSQSANTDYIVAAPTFEWILADDDTIAVTSNQIFDDLVDFSARAYYPDGTTGEIGSNDVTYVWQKIHGPESAGQNEYKEVMSPQGDYAFYYILDEENNYVPYYGSDNDNDPFNDESIDKIYVKYSTFTPDSAGTYRVKATNRYAHNKSQTTISHTWVIAGPEEPVFIYPNTEKKLVLDPITKKVTLSIGTQDEYASDEWWYKDADNDEFIQIAHTGAEYEVNDQEGYYFRKVTNSKNNSEITGTSEYVWVRHQASVPVITGHYVNDIVKSDNPIGATSGSVLKIVDNIGSYEYGDTTYQWYKGGQPILNATTSTYQTGDAETGTFYCIITNSYKETTASTTSNSFTVTAPTSA